MEHVFLTAVTVEGPIREVAEKYLHTVLPKPAELERSGYYVESWWIAEDDRRDRSDNDSAVFVPMGHQAEANERLRRPVSRSLRLAAMKSTIATALPEMAPSDVVRLADDLLGIAEAKYGEGYSL